MKTLLSGFPAHGIISTKQAGSRHKNSTKPHFAKPMPRFYQCPFCQRLIIEPDTASARPAPFCCGGEMTTLIAQRASRDEIHQPHMQVWGGFDRNSLTVTIGTPEHPMTLDHHIVWIYLYSFQGSQLKFLAPGETSSVTFALADKDAYVYCDRAICKGRACKFNCKRGLTAWAYCNRHGLWCNSF